jgi:hypothetical protein
MNQYSDWPNKLQHVLADARIPKEEFTAIEVDQPTGIGSD